MRLLGFLVSLFVVASSSGQSADPRMGLLVMAHGGSPEWNQAVEEAVRPLRDRGPVSIAFGMANPVTLQQAVDDLVEQGAGSIGVVRLFVSGASFLPETNYAFGLRAETPSGHHMHRPQVLRVDLPVRISTQGLLDADELAGVLADRALGLSVDPRHETILIVGHGPGDDAENEVWLERMDRMADSVRAAADFHHVKVANLREDWTGKREMAETQMRAFVTSHVEAGRTVLIIPFRLHGFGPYAEVFEGLPYRADGIGFLPDARITAWIETQFGHLKGGAAPRGETATEDC